MATKIQTYTLLGTGETVLSKDGSWPIIYPNRKQAYRRADILREQGVSAVVIHRGRPFYVRLEQEQS